MTSASVMPLPRKPSAHTFVRLRVHALLGAEIGTSECRRPSLSTNQKRGALPRATVRVLHRRAQEVGDADARGAAPSMTTRCSFSGVPAT